jgi:hypothetical protein
VAREAAEYIYSARTESVNYVAKEGLHELKLQCVMYDDLNGNGPGQAVCVVLWDRHIVSLTEHRREH